MNDSEIIEYIANDWTRSGLKKGDTVLIHSSMKRTFSRYKTFFQKEIASELILESFIKSVGEEGTLLFPLFNFDFTKGTIFDFNKSKSQMGILTETARKHPKSVRTGHPIYSFSVIGRNSHIFDGLTNFSGYGSDSPFRKLYELNGKIAVIDLPDQNSQTFYHHVEEMHLVNYRYHKKFRGKYIDQDNIMTTRTFGLFVRDLDRGVKTHVNPMGEILWEKKLYSGFKPNIDTGFRIINARAMFNEVSQIISNNEAEGILYRIDKSDKN